MSGFYLCDVIYEQSLTQSCFCFVSGASDDATSDSGSSLADAEDDDLAASRSSLDLSDHETQRESD